MTQTALITGAARRIGRATAAHLHALGYDVAIHFRHSQADALRLRDELNALRPDSSACFGADLATAEGVASLVAQLREHYDSLQVLVNNASGFEPTPIESCAQDDFDAMIDSNLRGPYFLVQGLLPLLRSQGGSIVNILDTHVDKPLPRYNVYGAAKAGLASLTRSLAVELGPDIRVNGVAPGAILWPESGDAYSEADRARAIADTPLQRMGEVEDIAEVVGFLARDARFVTGQVIAVDGGKGLAS